MMLDFLTHGSYRCNHDGKDSLFDHAISVNSIPFSMLQPGTRERWVTAHIAEGCMLTFRTTTIGLKKRIASAYLLDRSGVWLREEQPQQRPYRMPRRMLQLVGNASPLRRMLARKGKVKQGAVTCILLAKRSLSINNTKGASFALVTLTLPDYGMLG
jgi:hypothetical protein